MPDDNELVLKNPIDELINHGTSQLEYHPEKDLISSIDTVDLLNIEHLCSKNKIECIKNDIGNAAVNLRQNTNLNNVLKRNESDNDLDFFIWNSTIENCRTEKQADITTYKIQEKRIKNSSEWLKFWEIRNNEWLYQDKFNEEIVDFAKKIFVH
jgi:hypothetical protein